MIQQLPDTAVTFPQGIVEKVIKTTKQTYPSQTEQLLKVLAENALNGTITYAKSLITTLTTTINALDAAISKQLAKVMHDEKFKKLEGTWRGLHYLVNHTETDANLQIKVLNVTKRELAKDLTKSVDYDQSQLFKKIYENEFGSPGGEPYGVILGDYEFTNQHEDIEMLRHISAVAAAAFCPFIAAASSNLFGFNNWTELSKPRDLEKIFATAEYTAWRSFRESDEARFVALVLPRVLARLPYGQATLPVEEFNYEETEVTEKNQTSRQPHNDYCWMNAAYVLAARITEAQAKYGFATAIRGAEGGGKVENLPLHTFLSDNGDVDSQCPTEVGITDRREVELSKLGFLPLCHYKNSTYAVFFGAQSVQKPKKYDRLDAMTNATISSRLPYLLATGRFAHYLKIMARDKIGGFMEATECEEWLNRWILTYVNGNAATKQELKAKYPLAEAQVQVKEIAGQAGAYHAIVWLRPWLQLEELTTSMRLVARIPKLGR